MCWIQYCVSSEKPQQSWGLSDPKVNNPEGSWWIGKFCGPMMDHKRDLEKGYDPEAKKQSLHTVSVLKPVPDSELSHCVACAASAHTPSLFLCPLTYDCPLFTARTILYGTSSYLLPCQECKQGQIHSSKCPPGYLSLYLWIIY